MKKNFIFGITLSAIIMLILPWLAVTFVPADAGMAVCLMLFYAVNPIYSVIIGTFAGKDMRRLFALPIISALLFLAGIWIFFGRDESAFIFYGTIYLFLGIVSMLISNRIQKKIHK